MARGRFKYRDMEERIVAMTVIEIIDGEEHWIWTGASHGGYGKMMLYDKQRKRVRCERAHRVSYAFFMGPIPAGFDVHHKCRVTKCVRPDHLEPQSTTKNRSDNGRSSARSKNGQGDGKVTFPFQ